MLTRRKPARMGLRQEPQIRCEAHLKWVRGFACLIAGMPGHDCEGRIEAAHVRTGTDGGLLVKPSDIWAVPLCSSGHALQHQIGEQAFEARFKVDMKAKARLLARTSPHRHKWEGEP